MIRKLQHQLGLAMGPRLWEGRPWEQTFRHPCTMRPHPQGIVLRGQGQGRLRIQQRDGTVVARAVSPNGRHAHSIDQTWSSEYGLGTVTFSGLVYRILPDAFLDGSLPMN